MKFDSISGPLVSYSFGGGTGHRVVETPPSEPALKPPIQSIQSCTRDIPRERFSALTRLDHNRAIAQLAHKTGVSVNEIRKMTIWGNHSATQYPDLFHAEVSGRNAAEVVGDQDWLENTFIPTVQKRGAAIIEARGLSSAASAANAAIDHVRDWVQGTPADDWVSMGIPSDGSYGIAEGILFGYPVKCSGGRFEIVKGLEHNEFAKGKIAATRKELLEERSAIEHLLK